ncbi:hypothetical protein SEUBUCD646_0L03910 [Saccharomyces eubayanus]|uniref:Sphingolipid homeostasis protein orm2 n=2 Tax=Saccharomyces TaxID=4930 RepID=A0A6C1EE65_SACPS|nr:ORM2-like protein [Saccharomyces eubayanus]KOG98022.1 ORM2-like protein [Saccharomyces eubayanus]QID86904.1 sphingolipid homeostasis protein orm2 [Saccharomyces pastorianus]CAI1599641.1 hypothetical protein SEUBUCD650_0L03900 [Saccharomyces eubayanus]CAI1626094.1 hypothetical protein SEUBUCD646_0L03910 [Saccharomyces eubayanus]
MDRHLNEPLTVDEPSLTPNVSSNLKPFPSQSSKMSTPVTDHRRRRSSSVISHVEPETFEDENDQQMLPNMNATWVDQRGAWLIHIVVIVLLRLFYSLFPGSTPKWTWTFTNMTYIIGFYVMFHLVKGTPFEFNGGAYDNLTMWEQINNETLYTPTRKFLLIVPIVLFLISNQYYRNDITLFLSNLLVTVFVGVVPKLGITHRLRISIPGITGRAQIS